MRHLPVNIIFTFFCVCAPQEEVAGYREQYQIEVQGVEPPNPITKFEEGLFPPEVMEVIRKKNFQQPTSIQAQTWPVVLQGRDLVGIAQTGTGKTMAYILPAILHIKNQAPLKSSEGPIALVVAPTRELVQQIHQVAQEFTSAHHLRSVCLYGGANRAPQVTGLNRVHVVQAMIIMFNSETTRVNVIGAHLVIATPGRLIDMMESCITNLERCSYLVLDEADRMLDMGFEPQVRAIMEQTRKDRQTLMWSATWPTEIRKLASDFLSPDTVQVNIGSTDRLRANHNIAQHVEVCEEHEKREMLLKTVQRHSSSKMLIFAQTKKKVDWLVRLLQGFSYVTLKPSHVEPNIPGKMFPLVKQGLDVSDIEVVINFDFPNVAEDYIHRIGRTGRVDKQGLAYTLFTPENQGLAAELVHIMEEAGQNPPESLVTLAENATPTRDVAILIFQPPYVLAGSRQGYKRNDSYSSGPRRFNSYGNYNNNRRNYNNNYNDGYKSNYRPRRPSNNNRNWEDNFGGGRSYNQEY
ncbi:hypothetical protein LAZ67_21002775 [Cordylochernes scorpioides]|uniref:RNA helicase n=1 Tax=Cordylochernes scorpioides TaxID=51811 RepID=A0ABY6LPS0_9ARAC|nr:hypothetical protein LAZ67_21002775 [Cordylochernes scorpioides]